MSQPEKRQKKMQVVRVIRERFDDRDANGHGEYGWRSTVYEDHEIEIEISVDYEAIARELGNKAFGNKNGVARSGCVTVRVLGSKKLADRKVV